MNKTIGKNSKLAPRERRRYEELKKTISSNLWQAAEAAEEIQNRKLYLEEYDSFKDFIEAELPFSKQRFYQLLNAKKGQKRLETATQKSSMLDFSGPPEVADLSVRAAEEIGKADEKDVQKIIDKSVEIAHKKDSPLTAAIIKQASKEIADDKPKEPKPGSEKLSPAKVIDEFYKAHFPAMVRGLDKAAEVIGKMGPNYKAANDALNVFSAHVKLMREGKA